MASADDFNMVDRSGTTSAGATHSSMPGLVDESFMDEAEILNEENIMLEPEPSA